MLVVGMRRRSTPISESGSAVGVDVGGRGPFVEDVRLVLSQVESTGGTLSLAQKIFRDRWLGPR